MGARLNSARAEVRSDRFTTPNPGRASGGGFLQRIHGFFQNHRPAVAAALIGATVLPGVAGAALVPRAQLDPSGGPAYVLRADDYRTGASPERRFALAVNHDGNDVGNPDLWITGDQKAGIKGKAHANDIIEAINLTTAAPERLHVDDVMEIGRAGADGKFSTGWVGQLTGTHEGDWVRLRSRSPATGKTSDWVTIRVHGLAAKDTFNALVDLDRISLSADDRGYVKVSNLNEGREVSEPFARLYFKNLRTGQGQVVTLNEDGTFPADTKISGQKGDAFQIGVSDGVNNVDFSDLFSRTLKVPGAPSGGGGTPSTIVIPEPKLDHEELDAQGNPLYQEIEFTGPLFSVKGPIPEDVKQGQLGDCYFPSAIGALAQAVPDVLKHAIVRNDDGTYTVFFKQRNDNDGTYTTVQVGPMSGKLYVRPSSGPLYGAGGNVPLGEEDIQKMDLWFPLLEKAYAAWKGSYDVIGNGGSSAQVFQDLLGMDAREEDILDNQAGAKQLFDWVKHAVDNHLPASLGTYGDSEQARYRDIRLYADHSYSVLGYKVENGKMFIKLRNPWGEQVPSPDLGNGIFWLEASKAAHYFTTFFSVEDQNASTNAPATGVVHQTFDPARELDHLGVKSVQLGPSSFDPKSALVEAADGRSIDFAYPNASDPRSPTRVRIVAYEDWAPKGSAAPLSVEDPAMMAWLKSHDVGSADNYERTNFSALRRWVEGFLEDHRHDLKNLGIKDVRHLTPKQAANLAGFMTARAMRYDDAALHYGGTMFHPEMLAALERLERIDPAAAQRIRDALPKDVPRHVRDMDELGLDTLVRIHPSKDNPQAETGVCRNSTEMFQGLFAVLTEMQDTKANLLRNTYVKMPSGEDHIWIALYTVEADRTLSMAQLEPTWPAHDVSSKEIQAELNRPVKERALYALYHLQLGMNGTTRLPTDQDYDLVKLDALDLAARGKAEDGARLLVQYTEGLPSALRHNWVYLLNHDTANATDSTLWHWPGETALYDALRPMLPGLRA